jgi:hypothetical protein
MSKVEYATALHRSIRPKRAEIKDQNTTATHGHNTNHLHKIGVTGVGIQTKYNIAKAIHGTTKLSQQIPGE